MKNIVYAKSSRLVALFAIFVFCVSCAEKFDFDTAHNPITEEKEQYNNRFLDIVGDIDPDHNWSTAQPVGVQVAIDIPGTHTLRLYTADPNLYAAYTLGVFEVDGQRNIDLNFDMPATLDKVFAVLDSGSKRKSLEVEINREGTTLMEFDENTHHNYSVTRATTRATGQFEFDGDEATVYITTMPSGLPEISSYQSDANNHKSYYVSTSTSVVNAYAGNCDIYFPAGEYTITSWATRDNTNVHLLPGAKVKFTNSNGLNENYSNNVWAVTSGATLEVVNDLTYNFKLYNRGNIKAKNLGLYANSFIYNAGSLVLEEAANIYNDGAQLVNAGNLNCVNLNVYGSGHFLNIGTAIASDKTTVNSNYCTWGNEGTYTTDYFTYTAGSNDVYTNCNLTINKTFKIILGESSNHIFKIGANSSVVCKDFEMGIGRVEMGDQSMLKATNSALMGITKLETYGIYGPNGEGEFALFTAPHVTGGTVGVYSNDVSNQEKGYMAVYGGRLYVASDDHFQQGYSGQYPYIAKVGDFVNMVGETAAPSITDLCSGSSYTGTGSTTEEWEEVIVERYFPWVVACEDLGSTASSDFDFNDVVFGIEIENRNNGYYAAITPLAAGGTLEAYITYKDVNGDWKVVPHPSDPAKSEIHKWISDDANASITRMLNTYSDEPLITDICSAAVALPSSFSSMSNFHEYFGVRVIKNGEQFDATQAVNVNDVLKNEETVSEVLAPKMFCVEDVPAFRWMEERVPIINAYSEFATWSADHTKSQTWFKIETYLQKKVVQRTETDEEETTTTTTTTETPNGYVVKVGGEDVTSLSLNYNESKTISVWAIYTNQNTENVTSSATIELYSGDGLIVNNSNKTVSGNLAKILDNTTYTFEKLSGDYNNNADITGDNSVAVKVGVNSKVTKTYKAAATEAASCKFIVKIAGTTVATIPVTVTPEAVTDANRTTEENVNVTWSWDGNPSLSNYYSLTQDFTATTSGTLTATQSDSNNTKTWNVTVNTRELTYELSVKTTINDGETTEVKVYAIDGEGKEDVTSQFSFSLGEVYNGQLTLSGNTLTGSLPDYKYNWNTTYSLEKDSNYETGDVTGEAPMSVTFGVVSKKIDSKTSNGEMTGKIVATMGNVSLTQTITVKGVDSQTETKASVKWFTADEYGNNPKEISNSSNLETLTYEFASAFKGRIVAQMQEGSWPSTYWQINVSEQEQEPEEGEGGEEVTGEEVVLWEGTTTSGKTHGIIELSTDAVNKIKAASQSQVIRFYYNNNDWDQIFKYDEWNCQYNYVSNSNNVIEIRVSELPSNWNGKFYSQNRKTYKVTLK